VPQIRVSQAAGLLGVSDDTIRRWIDGGQLAASLDDAGRKVLDGAGLAAFARAQATATPDPSGVRRSARNRFVGLVTDVRVEGLVAQVELQCGPHRLVSLMTAEAARELALTEGSVAVAVVKATQVVVETT